GFFSQLPSAGFGDFEELRLAVVFGDAPFGLDEALLLETNKGRIDGSLIEEQNIFAYLLEASRDSPTVLRSHYLQRSKDHQIESSLQDLGFSHRQGSC